MVQSQPSPSVEMSPQWQEFIGKKVNSFIKWDLIRFFHDNPHIQDTAENIAGYVGRDTKTIIRELDGLVANNILNLTVHKKIKILASQLAQLPHEDVYIMPAVRELLDKYENKSD